MGHHHHLAGGGGDDAALTGWGGGGVGGGGGGCGGGPSLPELLAISLSALAVGWSTPALFERVADVCELRLTAQPPPPPPQQLGFAALADLAHSLAVGGAHRRGVLQCLVGRLDAALSCTTTPLELHEALRRGGGGGGDGGGDGASPAASAAPPPHHHDGAMSLNKTLLALALACGGGGARGGSSGVGSDGWALAAFSRLSAHPRLAAACAGARQQAACRTSRYARAQAELVRALHDASAQLGAAAPPRVQLHPDVAVGPPPAAHGGAVHACAVMPAAALPSAGIVVYLLRDRDVMLLPNADAATLARRLWVRSFARAVAAASPAGAGGDGGDRGDGRRHGGDRRDDRGVAVDAAGGAPDGDDDDSSPAMSEELLVPTVAVVQGAGAAAAAPSAAASGQWQQPVLTWHAAAAAGAPAGADADAASVLFSAVENPWAHAEMQLLAQAGWTVVPLGVPEWLALSRHERAAYLAHFLRQAAAAHEERDLVGGREEGLRAA